MRYSTILFFCLLAGSSFAQSVNYMVRFPNAVHHEAEITLTVNKFAGKTAIARMSRSSPGRYATHEFGKNVYDVQAFDPSGKSLALNRTDADVYEVPNAPQSFSIRYTLYANYADGTYAGINPESIHMNMPACFMWVKGMEQYPIELRFEIPAENKGIAATQLPQGSQPLSFTAPNLQYFMDSPVKIGDLKIRTWQDAGPQGKPLTFRLALEAETEEHIADTLAERLKIITREAKGVFGEYPTYDYGSYTFIASLNPYVKGDGMEHRNSTMISGGRVSTDGMGLGVFAHEFFHCWNVERIRPADLEPFNFEKSNMSCCLWLAEGFTQYYGELILKRAGLWPDAAILWLSARMVSTKNQSPGALYYSPVDASNHAPFVDAAVSIDQTNYPNMHTSYYNYGEAIAFALDLEMLGRFGKSLDAFMQELWKRFGKPEKGYTLASLQEALAAVTNSAFAADFFKKYITGHEAYDYGSALAKLGYDLTNSSAGKPFTGLSTEATSGRGASMPSASNIITQATRRITPAYQAGLDVGDEIVAINNQPVKSAADIAAITNKAKPGDAWVVEYKQRGKTKQTNLTVGELYTPQIVPYEQVGKTPDESMIKLRKLWRGAN